MVTARTFILLYLLSLILPTGLICNTYADTSSSSANVDDDTEICGNGICNDPETCSNCPADCGSCSSGGSSQQKKSESSEEEPEESTADTFHTVTIEEAQTGETIISTEKFQGEEEASIREPEKPEEPSSSEKEQKLPLFERIKDFILSNLGSLFGVIIRWIVEVLRNLFSFR